ncbi:cob(I)yrinic acid a,c-diamide adenosyltransferase [Hydrogenivirga sp. 128-5-R1-1]|uniref:cob(I)yrinic acid a,c-diamide adenosyltransferase n=1 Tax=Hydrogenivirga sp. 128-5-R1-1 TaxID=392423 RepID=UPI0002FE42AC|nr:cob(I)yrinic acid a,c-diamide adenosyltransferase [Hydrogenivirga sp. 128-5-R1-1]
MIYIFTGNGKGKTTAAIGTGIRAVGAGLKVLMVKFMKEKGVSSEDNILDEIQNFDLYTFGRKGFYLPKKMLEENPELKKHFKLFEDIDYKFAEEGFNFVKEKVKSKAYDLYILDEICVALNFKLLNIDHVKDFLLKNKEKNDFILTGRNCPESIIVIADLITEMREIKHPFEKGIKAKKGIDY